MLNETTDLQQTRLRPKTRLTERKPEHYGLGNSPLQVVLFKGKYVFGKCANNDHVSFFGCFEVYWQLNCLAVDNMKRILLDCSSKHGPISWRLTTLWTRKEYLFDPTHSEVKMTMMMVVIMMIFAVALNYYCCCCCCCSCCCWWCYCWC